MKAKIFLLDDMAKLLNKSCLSDLHGIALLDLINAIEKIDIHRYNLEQWNYVLSYILRTKIKLTSKNDIIKTLVSFKQ